MPAPLADKKKLYFIAIIPPHPVYDDAMALKNYFKAQYESKASLNSPPHITLHMPFQWKEEKENLIADTIQQVAAMHAPFKICIDNFSSFEPRVIFMNVVKSETLAALQRNLERHIRKNLHLLNANYREDAFHPHMTLAFRDLKKAMYKTAWEEFKSKEYKAEFMADKIALLKHNGATWEIFREIALHSSYNTDELSVLKSTEG